MASGELGHDNLSRALTGLAQALALDGSGYPFWKFLRSCLVAEGLDVPNSPRAAIKAGLDRGFVVEAEYQPALDMVSDRNTCSHIYRQTLIPGILSRLPGHCQLMQTILDRLPR